VRSWRLGTCHAAPHREALRLAYPDTKVGAQIDVGVADPEAQQVEQAIAENANPERGWFVAHSFNRLADAAGEGQRHAAGNLFHNRWPSLCVERAPAGFFEGACRDIEVCNYVRVFVA
jgi:hypothetical protein